MAENLNKIITLYHGSISFFEKPDADKGKPFKDFGRGFYLSKEKRNAINIAFRNKTMVNKTAMKPWTCLSAA